MATTELQPVLPQPMEQDNGPGLSEYLGILRRRVKLLIIPFFLCLVLSAVVAYVIPAQFTQQTKFKIEDPGLVKNLLAGLQATVNHKPLLRTMSSDIKSRRFLAPIVDKIGLNEGFNRNNPLEETEFYGYVFSHLEVTVPDLRQRTSAGADLVTLTYTGRNQALNVEFLNEIRESYKEFFRREYRETIRGIYDQQRARVRDLRNELARTEAAYEAFRNGDDYHLVGVKKSHLKQMVNLRGQESQLRLDIKGYEAQIDKIKMQLRDQSKTTSVLNQSPNPQLIVLQGQIVQAQALLNQMIKVNGFTEKVPAVQDQRKKIEELKETLRTIEPTVAGGSQLQQNQIYVQLENDSNNLQRVLDGSRDMLGQVSRSIEKMQGDLAKESDLTRTDTNFSTEIADLVRKERQMTGRFEIIEGEWKRIQGEGSDLFTTVDFPNPNTKPVFPSVPLFLAIGAGVGALLGLGLAFLKEFSSLTYLTPAQVQNRLTVPILGEVSEIKTEEEKAEEKKRKRRNYLVGGIVLGILVFVHYCYFEESKTHFLPPIVVKVLDMLYQGG